MKDSPTLNDVLYENFGKVNELCGRLERMAYNFGGVGNITIRQKLLKIAEEFDKCFQEIRSAHSQEIFARVAEAERSYNDNVRECLTNPRFRQILTIDVQLPFTGQEAQNETKITN